MVGEVHCDLLVGADVATGELIEEFQDCIMTLVVASALEGHRAVVEDVQQCLAIRAQGTVWGRQLLPQVEVSVVGESVLYCVEGELHHFLR